MAHIAIVGAGMAGLSALQLLKQAGHQVTVFDKSRGSGGRMATKKVGNASWDMGAQFMRSHHSEFTQELRRWQLNGWIEHWNMQPHVIDADGIRPSPDDVERYVGVNRMTALSRQLLAAADDFVASARIVDCQFDGQQWQLSADDQRQFSGFDALIINTPPLQAKPLLAAIAPELSAQCDVPLMPAWTLLLAFDQPLDSDVKAAFVHHPIIDFIAQNSDKPQRDGPHNGAPQTWVVHANHHWTEAHTESPRDWVQQQMLDAFFEVMRQPAKPLAEVWLHRWLYAIVDQPLHKGALSSEQLPLTVCGDWLEQGAIEGAWLSGRKAAELTQQRLGADR